MRAPRTIRLKTREEIIRLREGGRHHAEILKALQGLVVSGVSTSTLEEEARRLIKDAGDEASFLGYQPEGTVRLYPAALCVSLNDEIVHGIPNESPRILKDGDIVTLDLGLKHEGLFTDMAITIPVGTIDREGMRLIRAAKRALRKGIEAIHPGGQMGDIGAAIEAVARKEGFSIAEGLSGHGVGYAVHEAPYVPNFGKAGKGEKLVPGLVLAIEPMFCEGDGATILLPDGFTYATKDGKRSAHFEHTVAVTETGSLVLTAP